MVRRVRLLALRFSQGERDFVKMPDLVLPDARSLVTLDHRMVFAAGDVRLLSSGKVGGEPDKEGTCHGPPMGRHKRSVQLEFDLPTIESVPAAVCRRAPLEENRSPQVRR